jgi:hypothetical protein
MLKHLLSGAIVGAVAFGSYQVLKYFLGDTWLPAIIVMIGLIVGRIALFLYRRSKGIHDSYLDD